MIEIYGRNDCTYCEQATQLCKDRHLKYVYFQLGTDFNREELLEQFPNAKTFPQIRINRSEIGGYTQLVEYIEQTGYNGTGLTL